MDVKWQKIYSPFPYYCCDDVPDSLLGFVPFFAYAPYFNDSGAVPYEITDTAVGAEERQRLSLGSGFRRGGHTRPDGDRIAFFGITTVVRKMAVVKHRRRPEKADERDIDAWVDSLFSLFPKLDLKS